MGTRFRQKPLKNHLFLHSSGWLVGTGGDLGEEPGEARGRPWVLEPLTKMPYPNTNNTFAYSYIVHTDVCMHACAYTCVYIYRDIELDICNYLSIHLYV